MSVYERHNFPVIAARSLHSRHFGHNDVVEPECLITLRVENGSSSGGYKFRLKMLFLKPPSLDAFD